MTDSIVITMSTLTVMCFFVENINDLQLECLKIVTCLFTRYPKHRQLVFDDIFASLIKLHPTKRNARAYKCFNGVDSIQMFSALVLQLLQSEVCTLDLFNPTFFNSSDVSFEERETHLINTYESSCQTAKKFLSLFFSKCKTKQTDFDFRPLFESFIQDLLITVNKPEWPVTETILNLLGIILVSQIQNDQSDVSSRVNSLEYLGQIVSQLRKDSLEYQKQPEKIASLLDKLEIKHKKSDIAIEHLAQPELFNLQKNLILYLDGIAGNDTSLKFAKFFLIGQWLKELNQPHTATATASNGGELSTEHGLERVEKHAVLETSRKNIYYLIENASNMSIHASSFTLDNSEAFILAKYLASLKKTLDKNFDYYLINILNLSGGSSDMNSVPTQVRSKAIKCLSLIIEADPQILLKPKVFSCVEANFLHQTISVREASVDLIGRFITLKPDLTNQYYKLLSDRILDVGVSVRKRVIKVFRDVCVNQPDFEHLVEICVKILRRINDEDAIKKLVIDHFYSIWFSPINSHNKEQLIKRVLNIVDVVSELNTISNNTSLEIFDLLVNSLLSVTNGSNSGNSIVKEEHTNTPGTTTEQENQIARAHNVHKSSKQIVDCLIENVLNTEANTGSPQAYKRLVACFTTLYILSKIKPENFLTHAETILPYLNIKSTVGKFYSKFFFQFSKKLLLLIMFKNANDNLIIHNAARILECVVPLLQSPSNSFLISLEESLVKLILQGGVIVSFFFTI